MRLLLVAISVTVSAAAGAANLQGASVTNGAQAGSATCQRTTSFLAEGKDIYRGQPLKPRKLTELPPAIGYMAVYRTIGGCEAPLTMVDYRNSRRR